MSRRDKLLAMLEAQPDDPFLHFGLAMESVKEQRHDDALARFDRVMQLDPNYTAAHYHKGNTLIALGRLDDARAILRDGVDAARSAGDAHTLGEMQQLLDSIA